MRILPFVLLVPLAACAGRTPPPRAGGGAGVSAEAFFAGRTEGDASLKIVMRARKPVHVHGTGRVDPDGTLVLDQIVDDGSPTPDRRQWRITPRGPGHYAGTLSDAAGPVTGDADGNRLHLAFPMKGGLHADQWLTLRPDGQSAANLMIVRKWGMVVARLYETIRKVPAAAGD